MNRLANSSSPYLLQHANNPVEWYPWGAEALQKAKAENKLILVSIGYSACHWCHVMEHESFEDEKVAAVMNEYFVCIKVDREERPDVDQIYMSAVQLMTGRGGWPLNCICLPDQRPIYGGTYFRKNDWVSLLFNLADFYKNKPAEAEEYAIRLTEGINQYESIQFTETAQPYKRADLELIVRNWERYFDKGEGGLGSAPKFPMPNNWQFLVRYAYLMEDEAVAQQVRLTLRKMAFGGIYDHIGGGFARYSVDGRWHVPHFEKMLYDNAQLLSLYSEAYTWQNNQASSAEEDLEGTLYPQIADEIIAFVKRELTSPENGFYSALDADSEGVEGKFYTFTQEEIESILGDETALFCLYYNITEDGNWEEEGTNVLFRNGDDGRLAARLGLDVGDLVAKIKEAKAKVFEARSKRIRPGLDYKILASWNGLMLKGLCDAYRAFGKTEYLEFALRNAEFILNSLINEQNALRRVFKSHSVPTEGGDGAFLDDYANVIDAFIALYEVTFDENWLQNAKKLTDLAVDHYYDESSGIFFYTSDEDEQLIARKSEIMDNVIPASNSVMAHNLKKLGLLFDEQAYVDLSAQLLRNVAHLIPKYGSSYSNWAALMLYEVFGMYEIAIAGPEAEKLRTEIEKNYIPNKIILGGDKGSLPLLTDKAGDTTRIFVCRDKTCGLPVSTVGDALKQIHD
ncbi:MAG: thioredoxin domain-containing protein [Bacteroidetes bacterium]|nr:thioredoxin domain-containing protein [Bacteroidota bacterium]